MEMDKMTSEKQLVFTLLNDDWSFLVDELFDSKKKMPILQMKI